MRLRAPFGPGSFPNELDGDAMIKVGCCHVHVDFFFFSFFFLSTFFEPNVLFLVSLTN
jgi:hypothetical protein